MAEYDDIVYKKSQKIQKYFDKIKISRFSELTQNLPNKLKDFSDEFANFRTSLDSYSNVDKQRVERYREYDQMIYVPELEAGIEIYSDDASTYNDEDKVIDIFSNNSQVVETLEKLFFTTLDMNSNLWHMFYNTCKYGDSFYEVVPDNLNNPKKIKYLKYLPPQHVTRNEIDGNLINFTVRFPEGQSQYVSEETEYILNPWQVVHFKLESKDFDPYGKSVLESGRITFKQMKLIEDAMLIYRLSRAPERRVFSVPVGTLPYRDAMKRVEDVKQRLRKTPWIDPTCLSLNTRIPLLNDETKSLSEIIDDFNSGKENWVYSVDRENNNQIVPGKIIWAGVTRKNAKVAKITLDDGSTFLATPDHKFILRSGEYREVKDLKLNDSLMPLYTKETKRGYRSVYNPKNGKYYPRYMMSARFTNDLWGSSWKNQTTHHIDFNKRNDYPNNLELMEAKDHATYHAQLLAKLWDNPEFKKMMNDKSKERWTDPEFKKMMSQKTSERNKRNWQDQTYRSYISDAISNGLKEFHRENSSIAKEWGKFIRQFDTPENRKKNADSIREVYKNKIYTEEERHFFQQKSKEYWKKVPHKKKEYAKRMSETGKKYGPVGARLKNRFYSLGLDVKYDDWKNNLTQEEYDAIVCGITFAQIEEVTENKILTRKEVAKKLGTSPCVILNRVKDEGYSSWSEYCSRNNHRVISIEFLDEKMNTGTLTIEKYHNFAIGEQSTGIIVKNSGEINYKANPLCLTFDTKIDLLDGRSETLETLIKEYNEGKENWTYSIDRENGNQVVPGKIEWAGPTRKNAELVEVFIDNGKSVRCTPDHKFLLRNGEYKEAQSLQTSDSLMPKYTKIASKENKNKSNDHKVDKVVWLEDREDTGCITVGKYHNFATNGIIVKNSINDDFFVPVRPDGTKINIETLQGGQQLSEIDDVLYFKEKILRSMRIPLAYLTGEMSGDVAKTSLSSLDVRFAKTIERIQKMIIRGLEKLAIIELAFKRYNIEDIIDFQLLLTSPSKFYELQELEVFNQKITTASSIATIADESGISLFPREWVYKKIFKLNDQEITDIKLMQQYELSEKEEIKRRIEGQSGAESGGMPAGMAGGMAGGITGGGLEGLGGTEGGAEMASAAAGEVPETPPEEAPAEAGGATELELASKIMKVAGEEFILENESDIKELIKFVKESKEKEKITKDNFDTKAKKKKLYENGFNNLFILGEFKGLISTKKNHNLIAD